LLLVYTGVTNCRQVTVLPTLCEVAEMIQGQGQPRERVLCELDQRDGYVRDRDIRAAGVDPHLLARLVAEGLLERVARGLYRRADAWSEYRGLVDATVAAPHAVICLLSALEYYGCVSCELERRLPLSRTQGEGAGGEGVPNTDETHPNTMA